MRLRLEPEPFATIGHRWENASKVLEKVDTVMTKGMSPQINKIKYAAEYA